MEQINIQSHDHSVYSQIGDYLVDYIRSHKLEVGAKLPSVRQIAQVAGTSVRTVHRAIEDLNRRGICYQLPQRGIFVAQKPDEVQDKLYPAIGVYNKYGYEINHEEGNIPAALFCGIQRACREMSKPVVQFQELSADQVDYYSEKLKLLDTIIVVATDDFPEIVHLAEAFPKVHFLQVNYYYRDFDSTPANVSGVFNDDAGGAYRMAKYLLEIADSFAFVAYDIADENYRHRQRGCEQAVRETGRTNCPMLMLSSSEAVKKLTGMDELMRMFGRRVDAVFCANDMILQRLRELTPCADGFRPIMATYDNELHAVRKITEIPKVSIDFVRLGYRAGILACGAIPKKVYMEEPELLMPSRIYQPTKEKNI